MFDYTPDLAVHGAEAVMRSGQAVIDVSAEVLSNAAGSIIEATGDLAASVLEVIAESIGEIFS